MNVNRETFNRFIRKMALISSFIFLSSSFCYAGIYKWVDAQGNIHYGQQRPTNAPSERLEVQRYAPQNTSTYKRPGEKTITNKTANGQAGATEKKTQEAPIKKKETRAEKKERLASCKKTRQSLSTMESIGRIRVRDKDGNMTYMSQKKKEEDMKKARDLISKHCN